MNILFLTNTDPRISKGSGKNLRTHLLWNALKKNNRVFTCVYFGTRVYSEEVGTISEIHPVFCLPEENEPDRLFFRLLRKFVQFCAGMGLLPARIVDSYNPANYYPGIKFDIIVARYLSTACLFPFQKVAPLYIDFDDSPIQGLKSIITEINPPILRPMALMYKKLQLLHAESIMKGGWISNNSQLKEIRGNIKHLPNVSIPPSPTYNRNAPRKKYLFCIGFMGYAPNYLGVNKFLNEIWPEFHSSFPDIQFLIVGKSAPNECAERWNSTNGVEYLGYVDNIEQIYEECLASVVPIWSGSGTAIKTRESISYSRACLSTQFGVRGFYNEDISNGKSGLLVFNDSKEFIDAFKIIYNDDSRYKIEESAYKYYLDHLSMNIFEDAVESMINITGN